MRATISFSTGPFVPSVGIRLPNTCIAPRMPASGFFTSCAMTAAISPSLASAACSRSCPSICTRALRSCRMPVNFRSPCDRDLADRQMQRKRRAVLPTPLHLASDPDDLGAAGRQIARQIRVVLLVIRRRHQHVDVAAEHLLRRVAEQPFRGRD